MDNGPVKTVTITEQLFNFFVKECKEIHRLLDTAHVPRVASEGGKFTLAQRVEILVMAGETARAAIEKAKGNPTSH